MTMPHLMNCAHLDDGWCLDCVVTLNARAEAAEDRAEAAEQKLREIAQFTLKTNTRAEAAEAECERLRAQVAQAKADGANEERSLHWMRENTEIAALRKRVATLAALLDKAAALYADEWPSYFEDEVSAALEATA